MSNRSKRKLLFAVLALVAAFLIFITTFSLMPATADTAWESFVAWNQSAVDNVLTNFTLYALLAALVFGGGYLATRGK